MSISKKRYEMPTSLLSLANKLQKKDIENLMKRLNISHDKNTRCKKQKIKVLAQDRCNKKHKIIISDTSSITLTTATTTTSPTTTTTTSPTTTTTTTTSPTTTNNYSQPHTY